MKNIHIAFSGACCVGKTTLMDALCSEYPQFIPQRESVRFLKNTYGLDFRSGDTGLQMALLHMQTKLLYTPGLYFLDRTSLDSLAYSRYYRARGESDIPLNVFSYMEKESKENLQNQVDLIIFLRPEIPLIPDGTRITDPSYQKDTDAEMEKLVHEWGLEDKTIYPKGSVTERVEFCRKYIDKLLEERE